MSHAQSSFARLTRTPSWLFPSQQDIQYDQHPGANFGCHDALIVGMLAKPLHMEEEEAKVETAQCTVRPTQWLGEAPLNVAQFKRSLPWKVLPKAGEPFESGWSLTSTKRIRMEKWSLRALGLLRRAWRPQVQCTCWARWTWIQQNRRQCGFQKKKKNITVITANGRVQMRKQLCTWKARRRSRILLWISGPVVSHQISFRKGNGHNATLKTTCRSLSQDYRPILPVWLQVHLQQVRRYQPQSRYFALVAARGFLQSVRWAWRL